MALMEDVPWARQRDTGAALTSRPGPFLAPKQLGANRLNHPYTLPNRDRSPHWQKPVVLVGFSRPVFFFTVTLLQMFLPFHRAFDNAIPVTW